MQRYPTLILLAALLPGVLTFSMQRRPAANMASAPQAGTKSPESRKADDPFAKLRAEWSAALHAKQLDSLAMMYAPDAVFLEPHGQRVSGRPAIRDLCKKAMDTFTSDLTFHSIVTEQSGTLAYDSGDYQETLTANSDGAKTEGRGTYLMVLRRESNGRWLILAQVWTEASPAPSH
ncbi:MAG TPA: DUF4440 domain-containing protein [Candidatus Angelobacter sp.]|nr:DUF4440 domain-containing protein [Candidatus Angelobacter sp.]